MAKPTLDQKFIWINGVQLPAPDQGLTIIRSQLVDSGRNASGKVVAQKINRRQLKVDGLQWSYLTAAQWHTILTEIQKFTGTVKIWDARTKGFISFKAYWGDSSEEPFHVKPSGEIIDFKNCKCNVIDMGY